LPRRGIRGKVPSRTATMEGPPVSDLMNAFPTILLGAMLVLTLILLPLLNEERPARDDRQRTEEIRVPVKGKIEN
jgi:hypothetical protein